MIYIYIYCMLSPDVATCAVTTASIWSRKATEQASAQGLPRVSCATLTTETPSSCT